MAFFDGYIYFDVDYFMELEDPPESRNINFELNWSVQINPVIQRVQKCSIPQTTLITSWTLVFYDNLINFLWSNGMAVKQ